MDATEHADVAALELLAQGELEQEHGDAEEEEGDQVGNEEESTAPLVAEVGEAPEVTESDGGTDGSQHEGGVGCPTLSVSSVVRVAEELNALVFGDAVELLGGLRFKLV